MKELHQKWAGRRALVVSGDWLWPTSYATRIDALDRIETLNQLGISVDLLITAGPHDAAFAAGELSKVERCYVVQRSSSLTSYLGAQPGQVKSRAKLSSVKLRDSYDYVFLEGHYVASVLKNPTLKAAHTILRVQNDERLYFARLALSSFGLRSAYYLADALRFCRSWGQLLQRADGLMFISAKEHSRFAEASKGVSVFAPPRVSSLTPYSSNGSATVLFLGSLFMPNNREAIEWFLSKVHVHLKDVPGYSFIAAGYTANDRKTLDYLDTIERQHGVEVIRDPETTCDLYSRSAVFVNPMRNGAGLKLKTVHAAAAGMPVVATRVGNEGTGFVPGLEIFETDDAQEFTLRVRKLLTDRTLAESLVSAAQARLRSTYQSERTLDQLLSALEPASAK